MMQNQVLIASKIGSMIPPEHLPGYVKTSFRAVASHIRTGAPDFASKPVPFEMLEGWLRGYLSDAQRNGKRSYPKQSINNYVSALRAVLSAQASELPVMDEAQKEIIVQWEALRGSVEAHVATAPLRKAFRHAWPRFIEWMAAERVGPGQFDMEKWRRFRAWLLSRFPRHATGTSYAHALMAGLTGVGFEISQKKLRLQFQEVIEDQVNFLREHATSPRPIVGMGTLEQEELRTARVRLSTFKNYEQTMRLFLDFHRGFLSVDPDITRLFVRDKVEPYVLFLAQKGLLSDQSFVARMSNLIMLTRYLWEMRMGIFRDMDAVQMTGHLNTIKPLYGYKSRFPTSTVRARRESKPVPGYSEIYWKASKSVSQEIEEIRKERRRVDLLPPSPYKDSCLQKLASNYSMPMTMIMMILFACRPGDLFGRVTFKDSVDPETGEMVKASIYRSAQGTWMLHYHASKTDRIDKVAYKNVAEPEVYWAWPSEYVPFLEEYLHDYLPHLFPGSSLFLPGHPGRVVQRVGKRLGSRTTTAPATCTRLAEKFAGKRLGENMFRSMLQTFMVLCDSEHCEPYVVGHTQKSNLSKIGRKSYLQINDELIEDKARSYYERFFRKLNEARARMEAARNLK